MSRSLLLVLGCACAAAAGCSSTTADSMALSGNLAGALERYESESSYDAQLKAGAVHQARGEHGAAVIAFTRAIAANDGADYRVFQYRAESFLASGDPASAEADLDRALDRAPRVAQVHFLLGNLLVETGRLPGAVAAYSRAIACADDRAIGAHALRNRALAHYRLGELERAADDMRMAVERSDAVTSTDRYNLGLLLYAAGREDDARRAWRDLDPADRDRVRVLMHDGANETF